MGDLRIVRHSRGALRCVAGLGHRHGARLQPSRRSEAGPHRHRRRRALCLHSCYDAAWKRVLVGHPQVELSGLGALGRPDLQLRSTPALPPAGRRSTTMSAVPSRADHGRRAANFLRLPHLLIDDSLLYTFPFIHPRTSSKLVRLPTLPNIHHHTTANSCSMAKPSVPHTVHCGRFLQNRQFHRREPQYWHCPHLLTGCCLSNIVAIANSRTVNSLTSSGSTGSSPLSFFTHC